MNELDLKLTVEQLRRSEREFATLDDQVIALRDELIAEKNRLIAEAVLRIEAEMDADPQIIEKRQQLDTLKEKMTTVAKTVSRMRSILQEKFPLLIEALRF